MIHYTHHIGKILWQDLKIPEFRNGISFDSGFYYDVTNVEKDYKKLIFTYELYQPIDSEMMIITSDMPGLLPIAVKVEYAPIIWNKGTVSQHTTVKKYWKYTGKYIFDIDVIPPNFKRYKLIKKSGDNIKEEIFFTKRDALDKLLDVIKQYAAHERKENDEKFLKYIGKTGDDNAFRGLEHYLNYNYEPTLEGIEYDTEKYYIEEID